MKREGGKKKLWEIMRNENGAIICSRLCGTDEALGESGTASIPTTKKKDPARTVLRLLLWRYERRGLRPGLLRRCLLIAHDAAWKRSSPLVSLQRPHQL